MHPSASLFVTAGMAACALGVAAGLVAGYGRAARGQGAPRAGVVGFGVGIAVWLAVVAALGASGVLRRDMRPPPLFPLVALGVVLAVATARSSIGARLARGLPLVALVGFHAFRLPLELVMHRAASEGVMPAQMTFGGWNYDIVSGATAVVVAWLIARGQAPRWLIRGWAVLSSLLLCVIVVVAVTSTPLFAAFGSSSERLNTWIGWFPFTWLPCFLVPAAILGQLVLFRRLAQISEAAGPVRPSRA